MREPCFWLLDLTLSAADSVGGTEPTACKNNPILRPGKTSLIPRESGRTHSYLTKCFRIFPNYLSVPVELRGRCMRRLLGVLDMSTRLDTGATGRSQFHWLIQLLHKPLLQHRHSASFRWVWRGHLNPIHVRNVICVQLRVSVVVLRTKLRLDSASQLTNHWSVRLQAWPGCPPVPSTFMGTHVQISLSACPISEHSNRYIFAPHPYYR